MCSDAADYSESLATGPKLKVFRMQIAKAMESLAALEMLTSTPMEVGKECLTVASVMPPPIFAGPPPVAREYKWRTIDGLPLPEGDGVVEVIDL